MQSEKARAARVRCQTVSPECQLAPRLSGAPQQDLTDTQLAMGRSSACGSTRNVPTFTKCTLHPAVTIAAKLNLAGGTDDPLGHDDVQA